MPGTREQESVVLLNHVLDFVTQLQHQSGVRNAERLSNPHESNPTDSDRDLTHCCDSQA